MAQFDTTRTLSTAAIAGTQADGARSIFAKIAGWVESYQTRRALSRLTDRELADIGLNRCDINKF